MGSNYNIANDNYSSKGWNTTDKGFSEEMKYICLLSPINFKHKAGDGLKTREHKPTYIHPALQANCGATQATYILEKK